MQVNVSGESSKSGFQPDQVPEALEHLLGLKTLEIQGLMTMAPLSSDERVLRGTFRGLREIQNDLTERFPRYRGTELSMGMSNDLEVAIEEGATMVRVGTAIFGSRSR